MINIDIGASLCYTYLTVEVVSIEPKESVMSNETTSARLPVPAEVVTRFHKNLVAAGQGVQKNRGIIAKVSADLPAIVQGLDKDGATAARRDMYIHIIAGCVGSTPVAVEAAWKDQKTWSPDWLSAYGNARSIVSQAFDAAIWTDATMIASIAERKAKRDAKKGAATKAGQGATATPATPATPASVTPANLKEAVATVPTNDLASALAALPANMFAEVIAMAARMSYNKGPDAVDVHFLDAIVSASKVRTEEKAIPATPCKAA